MTQYTLKASKEEADAIVNGDKSYLFRDNRHNYKPGDQVTVLVMKEGRPVTHPIEANTYRISYTEDYNGAPLLKGWTIIGLKKVRP